MDFEQLDTYLLKKPGATFDYPFDEKVRVYRIADKMFALSANSDPLEVNITQGSKRNFEGNIVNYLHSCSKKSLTQFFTISNTFSKPSKPGKK